MCQFFSAAFAPKSPHFYALFSTECGTVQTNAHWQYDGIVFGVPLPDALGNYALGTQPVYRLYNNGARGASNDRYTISQAPVCR